MAVYQIDEILKLLPHRYPMLLVDRVLECDDKSRITGIKNLTYNEPVFQGHFPGHPIMPGVLQLEAMAQLGGILLNKLAKREGAIAYFMGVDKARFRRMLVPGDQLLMEVNITRSRPRFARIKGTITVQGELACEAELMFGYAD